MDLGRAFPDFDEARVVFKGDGLLVVDKPAGVPSQAAEPDVQDDLPARLRRLAPYLGTHQRLDADTSGLVLFTTDRAANGPIAAQFEGRRVKKRYVAGVTGWSRDDAKRTLRHMIDGKDAVTHVRLIETRADRSLLELELETGRTHQARVQLARAHAPIAGDRLYGGARAGRLMLHASRLELQSPSGEKLSVEAKMPDAMRAWLERGDLGDGVFDDAPTLHDALRLAFERRWGLLRAMPHGRETTVCRLADDAGDALPGLAVDFYGGYAVATFTDGFSAERRTRVLDALGSVGFDGVYDKMRSKTHDTAASVASQGAPARGSAAPSPLEILEEGTPFLVRLDAGLATGFYADQRKNRVRVQQAAGGKRVLNLFAYTCSFSVAASRGGATRTVSVDASAAALERGRESFVHAGLDASVHDFVATDARAYLERAARRSERFDLVVLDPPSFGRSRGRAGGASFSIGADFGPVCELAFSVLAPGGAMLATINHQKTTQDRFRHAVQDAARAAGRTLRVRDLPPPLDYPAARLKAVWCDESRPASPGRSRRAR